MPSAARLCKGSLFFLASIGLLYLAITLEDSPSPSSVQGGNGAAVHLPAGHPAILAGAGACP